MIKMPSTHHYLQDVTSLKLYSDKCIGCRNCQIVCPHRIFVIDAGKAKMVDRDRCIECGACQNNCPVAAISVTTGAGCASAIIYSWITGNEPSCGDDNGSGCC